MKEHLRRLLKQGMYEEANAYLNENVTEADYDDDIAVFDGSIGLYYEDGIRAWQACANGLAINPRNYELYVILGEVYLSSNINQAYLCYENALHFCNDADDGAIIQEMLMKMKEMGNVTVRNVSFVILSYNLLNYTIACIESIRAYVPESIREIVVVDNASEDGSVEWLREQKDIILVENAENVGFPKGCNVGIEVANSENDVFLLNNDTLMVENALFWLRMGLYENDKVGTTGSVSNYVGNMQSVAAHIKDTKELMHFGIANNVPMEYPYEEKLFLIGFALLIKRKVLNQVGGLDERYTPGNYEDNDYGMRVLQLGYKNVLCKNSFIIHFGSKSFGKAKADYADIMRINADKFKDKWQIDPRCYFYPRKELINLIEESMEKEMNILDVGCGCGAMLGYIKGLYPNTHNYGVESVKNVADFAKSMAEVVHGDIETLELPWEEEFFDYIIVGDVLAYLRRPDIVLNRLYKYVKKGGYIIASIPNVKHYSVILPLIYNDTFAYNDAGILNTSYVKLYTGTEIRKLMEGCNFKIRKFGYTTNGEPEEYVNKAIDSLLKITGSSNRESYFAYQYIVKAERT